MMLTTLDNVIGSLPRGEFQNCLSDWFSQMHKCVDTEENPLKKINWHQDLHAFRKGCRNNLSSALSVLTLEPSTIISYFALVVTSSINVIMLTTT